MRVATQAEIEFTQQHKAHKHNRMRNLISPRCGICATPPNGVVSSNRIHIRPFARALFSHHIQPVDLELRMLGAALLLMMVGRVYFALATTHRQHRAPTHM